MQRSGLSRFWSKGLQALADDVGDPLDVGLGHGGAAGEAEAASK
jgi:hypothetical protein